MKCILIADDSKKITAALSVRLDAAGYKTLIAHDGFTALKLAVDQRPDLILMDIWMPGMGLSILQQITELGLKIPVIVLTASNKRGLWVAAQSAGAAGFIQKPYEPQQLLLAVARALSSPASHNAA